MPSTPQLDAQFQYFLDNQAEINETHSGKYAVIADLEVKAAFDTQADAYEYGITNFEAGTFLIQLVGPGSDVHTTVLPLRYTF